LVQNGGSNPAAAFCLGGEALGPQGFNQEASYRRRQIYTKNLINQRLKKNNLD
jgi:hypothetical protein